jgi:hypothetical protein
VPVGAKQVEQTAERLGEEIAEDERGPREPGKTSLLPQTLSLGVDGTGNAQPAEELAGAADKQPHGSAKPREVKLGTIWSAEPFEEQGIPVRGEGSVTYHAALESAAARDTAVERSPFAQRAWREASRRRFCQAASDGGAGRRGCWVWNVASDQFLKPSRWWTAFMPSNIGVISENLSTAPQTHERIRGPNEPRKNSMPESSALS